MAGAHACKMLLPGNELAVITSPCEAINKRREFILTHRLRDIEEVRSISQPIQTVEFRKAKENPHLKERFTSSRQECESVISQHDYKVETYWRA